MKSVKSEIIKRATIRDLSGRRPRHLNEVSFTTIFLSGPLGALGRDRIILSTQRRMGWWK